MNVIVYENDFGGVAVCVPTGELPIEEVLIKDCPPGAFIIDETELPEQQKDFFGAWILVNNKVVVDINKAKIIANKKINEMARKEAAERSNNIGAGIENKVSEQDWLNVLSVARNQIENATTTDQMRNAILLVETAILDNE